MLAKILSAVNVGIESNLVEVEVDISSGFPCFDIVGLPDRAIEESKMRVRSAIINSGLKFLPDPRKKRLTINLAPADVKKEGSVYDLPMAVGILIASNQLPTDFLKEKSLFVGELALNGELRHSKGVLPMAILAAEKGIKNIFLPSSNAQEAALIENENFKIYPLDSLDSLIRHLTGQKIIKPFVGENINVLEKETEYEFDMAYVKGQEQAKRAIEIAAAGGHNILMSGAPGSGKTLLAKTIPSILPKMSKEEILDVTKIYSVAGLLTEGELKFERPFRSPHHTISDVAMVGGGQIPKPGEISLAHRGVLFLDEVPEFSRHVLESLRQPLEDGIISISRARGALVFPSKFILIAAQNPCPCGYYRDPEKPCRCGIGEITKYRKKISGPLLDRIDLHLEIPRLKFEKLTNEKVAESSKEIRKRVEKAREIQTKRFKNDSSKKKVLTNAEMTLPQLKKFCQVDDKSHELLKKAIDQFALSTRAYHRILKVSRTIADLAGDKEITFNHIAEAIQYRTKLEEVL